MNALKEFCDIKCIVNNHCVPGNAMLKCLSVSGPRLDLSLRRTKLASEDLMKHACRKPKELKVHKKQNVSIDGLGTKHGRIHVGKQEINKLQTRKMKGLRKSPKSSTSSNVT